MKNNKRGLTLEEMYPAVLTIILIGIVLGVGLYVLSEFRVSIGTETTAQEHQNATGTTVTLDDSTNTGYYLKEISGVILSNGSSLYSNATASTSGVVTIGNTSTLDDFINITSVYIYDVTDSPEATTSNFISGLSGFADWIAIIVVVIAAAVVLGIVLNSFGRRPSV